MADLAQQVARGMAALTATQILLMPDACTVTRPAAATQTPVLDGDGNVTAADGTTVYSGPCSMSDPKLPPLRNRTVQDVSASPEQRQLRVPHTANLQTGDVVTVTAAAYAPGLVGDRFLIVREDERSFATYRAFILRGSSWQA